MGSLAIAIAEQHILCVNSKVGTSSVEMTTKTSRYEDTPILDFIGKVQENTVASALKFGLCDGGGVGTLCWCHCGGYEPIAMTPLLMAVIAWRAL